MTEISLAAGYGSVRRFNAAVKRTYGRTPSEIRRGAPRRANATPALTLRLGYRTPFDVPWIFGFLAARAIPGVEQVDRDGYCRSLALGDKSGTIRVRPISGQDALELEIEFPDPARLFEIVDRVKRIFDLDAVPAEIAGCLGRDRRLGPLVRQWPGLRVPGAWDGFEIAVRAILGQQVSVQAATTLAGRLARCHGRPLARRAGDGPTHLFPTAEALARADPKTFGVPTARARAIGGLARAVCEGEVDFDRPADLESFVAGLTRLTGIGDWTAHYVAMRAAREPDAFPANDLGLLRAFAEDGRSLTRRRLQARAESWRPWRAYAAIYLWKADACRDDALERRHAL